MTPYTDEQLTAASQQVRRRFAAAGIAEPGIQYEQVAIGIQCELNRAVEMLSRGRVHDINDSWDNIIYHTHNDEVDAFIRTYESEAAK